MVQYVYELCEYILLFLSHICIQQCHGGRGKGALWGKATGNSPHWVYSSSTPRILCETNWTYSLLVRLIRVHALKHTSSDVWIYQWVYAKIYLWINIHTCKCMYTHLYINVILTDLLTHIYSICKTRHDSLPFQITSSRALVFSPKALDKASSGRR